MKPLFLPQLVNDPFGDPGLYVEYLFEKRSFLFDLGDLQALAPRKILRISDIFVSHTHMDHFVGFDQLLRISLGREKNLRLFGPPGFVAQVEHKLAAYTWNLVQNYVTGFTIEAIEIHPGGAATKARFRCQDAFRREGEETISFPGGVLLNEETFRVRSVFLDHKIPCLAFTLEEKVHVNVWKNRLAEMGFHIGPWLRELKQAVLRGEEEDSPFRVWWREEGMIHEKYVPLGVLKAGILHIVPGQKITYVTDVVYHEENACKIIELARDSDLLFIESTFLHADARRAAEKHHLTAYQAGVIAREAGVKRVIPFHFSPKYAGQEECLRQELEEAFSGLRLR